ncbi:MAG TPA: CU044_5270 family protein [Solirubrobacter sp.]
MTDPLTALRGVPSTTLDPGPVHARIDELSTRTPRRRRLPALALAVAAAVAAAVVLATGGTPTTTHPTAATAATLLHDLGDRAGDLARVKLTDGQYYAVRVHQYAASGKATSVDMRTWEHNGDGRELVLVDGRTKRDVRLGTPQAGRNLPDLATFPTDPVALAAKLRAVTKTTQLHPGSEPTARDYVSTAMQMVFDARQTPPAVLRGIYAFLATLPGMRLIGDVTDPLGRPGKAVAVDGDPVTQEGIGIELILAPDTGLPLATVHYRDGDVNRPWLYTVRQEGVVTGTDTLP